MSLAKKGKPSTRKGIKFTAEQIDRLSKAHKGQTAWNKGMTGYLSPESIAKARASAKRGADNPLWKGGITPLTKRIRNLYEYKAWKISVYKKYNSACQSCGISKHIGHAHHIKPFFKIFKEFLAYYSDLSPTEDIDLLENLARYYEPFWDINNGVVLCPDCHSKTYAADVN